MIDKLAVMCQLEQIVNDNPNDERFNLLPDAITLLKDSERKTGHWIFESRFRDSVTHTCSECGKRMTTYFDEVANFCWHCGAEMKSDY